MNTDEVLDSTPLIFGKYKGRTPDEIADDDPSYIVWMYETIEPRRCSRALWRYCKSEQEDNHRFDNRE